jgi:acetyl-CoA carboxylase carboxyltransferase component
MIGRLLDEKNKAHLGGGLDKIKKQHEKGKLSARERLELLLDEGIPHFSKPNLKK